MARAADPGLALRIVALVTSAAEECTPREGAADAVATRAWLQLILGAAAGNVREIRSVLGRVAPLYRGRMEVVLRAHGWCAPCAMDSRTDGGVHACDIVVEDTGQVCACVGCG